MWKISSSKGNELTMDIRSKQGPIILTLRGLQTRENLVCKFGTTNGKCISKWWEQI